MLTTHVALGDILVLHSTVKHHGLGSTSRDPENVPLASTHTISSSSSSQPTQPLPIQVTVFLFSTPGNTRTHVQYNKVYLDDDNPLPPLPPARPPAEGIATFGSHMLLGPGTRATLGLITPTALNEVLTEEADDGTPFPICPFHPCWMTRSAAASAVQQLGFGPGDQVCIPIIIHYPSHHPCLLIHMIPPTVRPHVTPHGFLVVLELTVLSSLASPRYPSPHPPAYYAYCPPPPARCTGTQRIPSPSRTPPTQPPSSGRWATASPATRGPPLATTYCTTTSGSGNWAGAVA